MKKVILSLIVFAAVSAGVSANNNAGKGKDADGIDNSYGKDLNLTSDQRQKMKDLRETYRMKHADLERDFEKDVDKILTPEQRSKWEKKRGNGKHHRGNKGGKYGSQKNKHKNHN